MAQVVDFAAGEAHFLDHLAPIWRALPAEHRGAFYVQTAAVDRALELGLTEALEIRGVLPRTGRNPTVVASVGDLRRAENRAVILAQHGAGQSYSGRHPSYPGGRGYTSVSLFLNPNAAAAARNRRFYPRARQAIVGCPKLDRWHRAPRSVAPAEQRRPLVAVSFHWPCPISPEAGSAYDDFGPELIAELAAHRDTGAIDLVGHGHPRTLAKIAPLYARLGVPVVADFDEVLARADLYVIDNSSTLFEFASLGRPVVVVNSPRYRRFVDHGLRFWEAADIGPNVDSPAEVRAAVDLALDGGRHLDDKREHAVGLAYAHVDGSASRRASLAIIDSLTMTRPQRCPVCNSRACLCASIDSGLEILPSPERATGAPTVYKFGRGAHPHSRSAGTFRLHPYDAKHYGVEPDGAALPKALIRRLRLVATDPAPLAEHYARLTDDARRSALLNLGAADNELLALTVEAILADTSDLGPPEDDDPFEPPTIGDPPPAGRVGDVVAWVNKADDVDRFGRAHQALEAERVGKNRPSLVAVLERILEEE